MAPVVMFFFSPWCEWSAPRNHMVPEEEQMTITSHLNVSLSPMFLQI